MSVSKALLVTVLFLLFMPLVNAYSLSAFEVRWNDYTVQTIAPDKQLSDSVLQFTASEDMRGCLTRTDLCDIIMEAPDMGLSRQTLKIKNACEDIEGTIVCTTNPFTFRIEEESVSVEYVGSIEEGLDMARAEATLSFIIDDTKPRVTSVRTGYCDENEQCYVAGGVPSPVTLEFTDEVTAFDYELVFIQGGTTSTSQVSSCSGTVCEGEISIPCSDGQTVRIGVAPLSAEDALNPPEPFDGEPVVCVAKPPEVLSWDITFEGFEGVVLQGESIVFDATVRVALGEPIGEINVSGIFGEIGENASEPPLLNANCRQAEDSTDTSLQACTFQISDVNPGTFNLRFIFRDAVGNYVTKEERIEVLPIVLDRTSDYFSIQVGEVKPGSLNRMAVALARSNSLPYPAYVSFTPVAKTTGARLHNIEFDQCWFSTENNPEYSDEIFAGADSSILDPSGRAGVTNRFDIEIRADDEIIDTASTFNMRCQLNLFVSGSEGYFEEPEKENISFELTLRETQLGQPGGEFVRKIQHEQDKLSGADQEFLYTLREVHATLEGVCTIFESLQGLNSLLPAPDAAGNVLVNSGYLAAAGKAINSAVAAIKNPLEKVIEATWQNGEKKMFVKRVCEQVTCNFEEGGGLWGPDSYVGGNWAGDLCKSSASIGATVGQDALQQVQNPGKSSKARQEVVNDVCADVGRPNFEDSFLMSAMYGCVGGMIHNAGKLQDINCGYLYCLKEQSLYGQSTMVCELGKSYKICTQVTSELFELPFVSTITDISENAQNVVENLPQHVISWVANGYCQSENVKSSDGNWASNACKWINGAINALDYYETTARGFDAQFSPSNICPRAMCTKENEEDCDLNFNKIAEYSEYTRYLNVNNWVRDKRNRQTKQQIRAVAGEQKAIYTAYKEYVETCTADGGPDCIGTANRDKRQGTGFSHVERNDDGSYSAYGVGGYEVPISKETSAAIEEARLAAGISENMYTEENFQTLIEGISMGIVVEDEDDVQQFEEWKSANTDNGEFTGGVYALQFMWERDALQEELNRLEAKAESELTDKEKKYKEKLESKIQEYDETIPSEYNYNTETGRWIQSVGVTQENAESLGVECTPPICDLNGRQVAVDGEGNLVYTDSGEQVTVDQDVTEEVKKGDHVGNRMKRATLSQLQTTMLSVGIQVLRDQGYLNFLSIGFYGQWGIDLIEITNTYLTKDGWSKTICNDLIYDINDNEDGNIVLISGDSFPIPVGTFAAEVRELEEGTAEGKYVYIWTVFIGNPERPIPFGVDPGEWSERYSFQMDMIMNGLEDCAEGNCENQLDLIVDTFPLEYGGAFGNGNQPVIGQLVSNARYKNLCITFNKNFPDSESGKKTYCREIKEDAFERGNPVNTEEVEVVQTQKEADTSTNSGCMVGSTGGGC